MCKCAICGKEIQRVYTLDGKKLGYSCYKMALALKYKEFEQLKNNEYSIKCVSAIEVFTSKTFKDEWNINFQKSILDQWNDCKKLTGKQYDLIIRKFNQVEYNEFLLTFVELSEGVGDLNTSIYNKVKTNKEDFLKINFEDLRIIKFLKDYSKLMLNNKKLYLVQSKEIDEDFIYYELLTERKLQKLQEDDEMEILKIMEA